MDRRTYSHQLITLKEACKDKAWAFAPSNVALCKYWGKTDEVLNVPTTSSLSISLGGYGSYVILEKSTQDILFVQEKEVASGSQLYLKTFDFMRLFCPINVSLCIKSYSNIPIGAGLASSASYFAALTLALNDLFGWGVNLETLSCLARLGSGSACRSFYHGFVTWEACENPLESYGIPLMIDWQDLCVGLLILDQREKSISSTNAMLHTLKTAPLYKSWIAQSERDFASLKQAICEKNFKAMGEITEYNALSLHSVMMSARPWSDSSSCFKDGRAADCRRRHSCTGTSTAASAPRRVTICGPSERQASRNSLNRAFAS